MKVLYLLNEEMVKNPELAKLFKIPEDKYEQIRLFQREVGKMKSLLSDNETGLVSELKYNSFIKKYPRNNQDRWDELNFSFDESNNKNNKKNELNYNFSTRIKPGGNNQIGFTITGNSLGSFKNIFRDAREEYEKFTENPLGYLSINLVKSGFEKDINDLMRNISPEGKINTKLEEEINEMIRKTADSMKKGESGKADELTVKKIIINATQMLLSFYVGNKVSEIDWEESPNENDDFEYKTDKTWQRKK